MKKKSVVQWVASRKIRWPASTYTSIVLVFFSLLLHFNICVCDFFYLFFRIWSRPIWMGGVGNRTLKKARDFGQMNYDDSSIWIETIGLEKLRPLFISQCEFNSLSLWDWKEIFIHIYIITTNNSLQIKWHRTDFVCMNC